MKPSSKSSNLAGKQSLRLDPVENVKMLGTEIDDIFSGKTSAKVKSKVVPKGVGGKSKSPKPGDTQTITMRDGERKKRKKKKKERNKDAIPSSKRVEEEEVDGAVSDEDENELSELEAPISSPMKKPKKRPRDEVEEVVDPSIMVKKPRLEKDGKNLKSKDDPAKVKKGGGVKGDLEKFKDSRGASGRKFPLPLSRIGPVSEGIARTDSALI